MILFTTTTEATVCRTQNSQIASFSSHNPGLTIKVYKENLAMFKTVKEQPIPVEGTVKGKAANKTMVWSWKFNVTTETVP